MGNYITADDIPAAVKVVGSSGELTAEEVNAIITRVEERIERVCRDYFYQKSTILKLDGNGKRVLPFGIRQRVLSLSAISISETAHNVSDFTYNGWGIYYGSTTSFEAKFYETDGVKFPKGFQNIEITCEIGWTETPEDIKQAAIILTEAEIDPTLHPRVDFETARVGDISYSGAKILTGVTDADALLRPYVNKRILATKI